MEISHPGPQHGPQIRAALRTCWGCHDFLGCNWNGAGYFHGREDAMGWRFAMGCGSDFGPKRLRSTAMAAEPGQGSPQLRGTIPPVHIDPASSWVGWPLIFGAFQGLIWGETRLMICLTHLSYPLNTSDYRGLRIARSIMYELKETVGSNWKFQALPMFYDFDRQDGRFMVPPSSRCPSVSHRFPSRFDSHSTTPRSSTLFRSCEGEDAS